PSTHARESVTVVGLLNIEALSVVGESQDNGMVLNEEINLHAGTFGMPDDVVAALFKDEENLAAHIGVEFHGTLRVTGIKAQLDLVGGEKVAGKAPHAMGQVAEVVPVGIDRPYNVAHGIHQFAGGGGNGGKRLGDGRSSLHLALDDFTEHRNLRQTRSDV